jgi:hypothetical protein
MANMSYCRFQNTLPDLRDCEENLDEVFSHPDKHDSAEVQAARRLVALCKEIAENYEV